MEESSFHPYQKALSVSVTGADVTTIIPRLIQDLESDTINVYIPALRELLNIVVDNRENKDLPQKYKLMPLLNKFAGNVEKNEEFVLSTTIQHVIGVRNGSDDKIILAGAAIESIIISLFSPDEKTSKSGSKTLEELIGENEIIRHSLMTTGFILKIQYAFTDNTTPYHVKCEILDIILKLVTTVDDLKLIAQLIPVLTDLNNNGEKETKKKAINILGILTANGINSPSSEFESELSKEKDERIQQLEEQNRINDEERNSLEVESQKLKKEIEKIKLEYPQDQSDFDFTDIDGVMKKLSKKIQQYNVVSLDQNLDDGVWELETEFDNNSGSAVGIVRDSYNIPSGIVVATYEPHTSNMAVFLSSGGWGYPGNVYYKNQPTKGYVGFTSNQKVKLEYDSGKGTLVVFHDGVQQSVYFTGIKEKVRFIVGLRMSGQTCIIRSLKKLASPTTGHVANEQAVNW
ncbi:MAG: hypothetical protein EZS28_000736 [Streblomastix strix]|uniref:Uncharacterized protein n=1 Tax=Streblomastix strix TaxID=222440 RepID=A0A5J4X9I6_9EUKA|nr:MAG: hypothetical protein EZS28_000736 [Streblomastix strix]